MNVIEREEPVRLSSQVLLAEAERLGYRDVKVFVGGKAAWKEAGLPFEVR
jgi:hypothetical protein